ncbi:MAG: hypothetical protein ACR2LR_03255 [Hassallia sp.]
MCSFGRDLRKRLILTGLKLVDDELVRSLRTIALILVACMY